MLIGCQSTSDTILPQMPEEPVQIVEQPSAPEPIEVVVEPAPELSPSDAEDVWQRIRMQLHWEISDHPRVQKRVNWYLQHPNYMEIITKRADPFLFYIVEQIEARDLPLELALMPLIESDFNSKAYSHKHASGMWQLTKLIARHNKVKVNWWYDGRSDIVDSTHAALNFLSYLHKRFDGNWLHAIAAYNTGEGRVARAIRNNKRAGKSTDFFSLKLPKETRHYVPKLLAAAKLLKYSQEYGYKWPQIENIQKIAKVELDNPIDLSIAADLANIEPGYLARINPGHKRFPVMSDGPGHLLLPHDKLAEFNQQLANLPKSEYQNWLRYKIRPGDSLIRIAKRHKVQVEDIKKLNNLKSSRIRAGKYLLLPVSGSDSALLAARNEGIQYRVKNGDSLWKIARRFGVKLNQIRQWNDLRGDLINPGNILKLYPNH